MGVELIELNKIAPGPEGLKRVELKEIVFTGHNEKDIEALIDAQYFTQAAPKGDITKGLEYWAWGFFKRSVGHSTYKENIVDMRGSAITMSEQYQQLGVFNFHYGALHDARTTFEILKNNYDIVLFVKYVEKKVIDL